MMSCSFRIMKKENEIKASSVTITQDFNWYDLTMSTFLIKNEIKITAPAFHFGRAPVVVAEIFLWRQHGSLC